MSLYDYLWIIEVQKTDPPFYGLVMLLMRKADDVNLKKLKSAWPGIWEELQLRYNAPLGLLIGEEAVFPIQGHVRRREDGEIETIECNE